VPLLKCYEAETDEARKVAVSGLLKYRGIPIDTEKTVGELLHEALKSFHRWACWSTKRCSGRNPWMSWVPGCSRMPRQSSPTSLRAGPAPGVVLDAADAALAQLNHPR
jgi:hypothetical protein